MFLCGASRYAKAQTDFGLLKLDIKDPMTTPRLTLSFPHAMSRPLEANQWDL